jgi:hypothetical protein
MPDPWDAKDRYLTALVCENGHVLSRRLEEETDPEKFCPNCGAAAISKCESCGVAIRGQSETIGGFFAGEVRADAYCRKCGSAYPWTLRARENFDEAVQLRTQLGEISADDATAIRKLADDVSRGSASADKARLTFQLWLKKYGKAPAVAVFGALSEFASSAIAKTITEFIKSGH